MKNIHKVDFATYLQGKPSLFPDKIWAFKFRYCSPHRYRDFEAKYANRFDPYGFISWNKLNPKIHTIRKDVSDKLKKGDVIRPVINLNTPQEFQFATNIEIKGIQSIEINYDRKKDLQPIITIDGKSIKPIGCETPVRKNNRLYADELKAAQEYDDFFSDFYLNCGFDHAEDFIRFFPENYKGKIIHFTNFKYNLESSKS